MVNEFERRLLDLANSNKVRSELNKNENSEFSKETFEKFLTEI